MLEPHRFYYLHNFRRALDWITQRYADLLSAEEFQFLQGFDALPQPAQALLVRMLMRRGPWFRASRLVYEEIPELDAAAAPLLALGWLDGDAPMAVDELFALHTKAELQPLLVELGLPALAVTDLNNLFALVKFYKAAEGVGIKPIAGADVLIAEEGQDPWRMTLLCRDREGYLSLSRLLTRAWMEGHRPEGGVAVHPDWLKAGNANLFALAGRQSLAGRLALDGKHELAIGSACSAMACTWS